LGCGEPTAGQRDSVTFSWTPSTGATAYLIGIYHFGKYGFNLNTSYVTKNTKLTLKGLPPLPAGSDYIATIWAFNPSGSYRDQGEFAFRHQLAANDRSSLKQRGTQDRTDKSGSRSAARFF
jgi:hypothetical protein